MFGFLLGSERMGQRNVILGTCTAVQAEHTDKSS